MARLRKLRRPGYGEKMTPGWRFVWLVLYYPVSGLVRLRYRNIEKIPQQGPMIIVVNHVSHLDPFLVSKFVLDAARVPRFLAKDALFAVPAVGWGMKIMGHIPVKRGSVDARHSLGAAVDALDHDQVIVLHPEGTVTREPHYWPMAGKTGAARLASLAPDVPVIPVVQWGVQEQFDVYRKRYKLVPRPKHVISAGDPIDLSAFKGVDPSPRVLREITDVIMHRLRSDLAELRGVPEPEGDLFRWTRAGERPGDAA